VILSLTTAVCVLALVSGPSGPWTARFISSRSLPRSGST